jgi:hypothetical protein
MFMTFSKSGLLPWGLELVNKYPLIFLELATENRNWAPSVPDSDYVNLRFGFECGEGWKELIENIAKTGTQLVEHLRGYTKNNKHFIHSCIVKEKLGGLRWQGSFSLPPPFQELWMAYYGEQESQSYGTCEITGKYGYLRETKCGENAWKKTLCMEEAVKRGYDLRPWEIEKQDRKKNERCIKP